MNKYITYIFPPLFYFLVAFSGSLFTTTGVWYQNLHKPAYTPPGSVIGAIWTAIYILSAISLITYINKARNADGFWAVIILYIANGVVNAAWSYIFFTRHLLGLAAIDAALIWITLLCIIILAWRTSVLASVLLFPYLGWVSFATYLNYVIYKMN